MSKEYNEVAMPERVISDRKDLDTLSHIGVVDGEFVIKNISFVGVTVEENEDNIRLTSKENPSDVWVIEKLKTAEK